MDVSLHRVKSPLTLESWTAREGWSEPITTDFWQKSGMANYRGRHPRFERGGLCPTTYNGGIVCEWQKFAFTVTDIATRRNTFVCICIGFLSSRITEHKVNAAVL